MFIRSQRLFLRPAWPEDWQEFHRLIVDEAVLDNVAQAPSLASEDETRAFIRGPREKLLPHLFITLPAPEVARLIGSIGLGRNGDDVEVGYWIARAYRGHGYATEAVRAMLNLARALGHKRLRVMESRIDPASVRVLEKAGFEATPQGGETAKGAFTITLDCVHENDGDDAGGGGGDMQAA